METVSSVATDRHPAGQKHAIPAASRRSPSDGRDRSDCESLSKHLPLVPSSRGVEGDHGGWTLSGLQDVPPEMDHTSYIAGEKAAMLRLFQEVIPSQQAIGALSTAVHYLKAQVREMQQVEGSVAALQATMRGQKERLDRVEDQRISCMEERIDSLHKESCPQEMVSLLKSMHGLHTTALAAHKAEGEWRQKSSLERLAITLKGWLSGSVSQLDVALLFMSRRILLGNRADSWMDADSTVEPKAAARERRRAAAGAAMFVLAVELGWQAQRAGQRALPWPLWVFLKPMRPGMKLLRTACWVSLLVLGAHEVRQYCLSLPFYMLPAAAGDTLAACGAGHAAAVSDQDSAAGSEVEGPGPGAPDEDCQSCVADVTAGLAETALAWLPTSLRNATRRH